MNISVSKNKRGRIFTAACARRLHRITRPLSAMASPLPRQEKFSDADEHGAVSAFGGSSKAPASLMSKKRSGANLANTVTRAAMKGRTATLNALHLTRSPTVSCLSGLTCARTAAIKDPSSWFGRRRWRRRWWWWAFFGEHGSGRRNGCVLV